MNWQITLSLQAKRCNAAGVAFLLTPEPEKQDVESAADLIRHPRDIIFSEEYRKASNHVEFLEQVLGLQWHSIVDIAGATAGQSSNPDWFLIKQLRLTGSNFGEILDVYKKQKRQVPPSLLKKLHTPPNLTKVKATMWGREHEPVALQAFMDATKLPVEKTGIWLHECGYLGASPDGLLEDSVVEVKCPYQWRNLDIHVALRDQKSYFIWNDGSSWMVNKDHHFWDQVMGQMLFSRKKKCHFIAWTPKSFVVIQILYDENWSANVKLLQKFYCEHFIPYVIKKECQGV